MCENKGFSHTFDWTFQGFSSSTTTVRKDIFQDTASLTPPLEYLNFLFDIDESVKDVKLDQADTKVVQYQIEGHFKDFIIFWRKIETSKVLEINKFFQEFLRMWEP